MAFEQLCAYLLCYVHAGHALYIRDKIGTFSTDHETATYRNFLRVAEL